MRSPRVEAAGFPFAVTDDAVLGGRLRLLQPARGHRAGHDAILLAAAAPHAPHAVDLGAGIGAAGLALLVRGAARRVTLIEIDADLARLAEANAQRNGLAGRTEVVADDVERVARRGAAPKAGSADLVLMNPPFNDPARRRSSPDPARRRAHAAADAAVAQWIDAADRLLRSGGRLVLLHRPDALASILPALEGRFGATEIVPIHPRPRAAALRVILRATKGRRTPPELLPGVLLAGEDGRPTVEAEAILRAAAPLAPSAR